MQQVAVNQEPHRHDYETDETADAAGLAGLLCLDRSVPAEVLHGLEHLANITAPFKVEVLRAVGGPGASNSKNDGWLDTLTAGINEESFSSNQAQETQLPESSGKGRNRRRSEQADPLASNQDLGSIPQQQHLSVETHEAVRWLKADIKRVASLFAREAFILSTVAMPSSEGGTLGSTAVKRLDEVTVKLELLKKGKCPRFHLDKVVCHTRTAGLSVANEEIVDPRPVG